MATVTMTIATPTVVTHTGHGLVAGKMIGLSTTGALPTGVNTLDTFYPSIIDVNSYYLSMTSQGASKAIANVACTFNATTDIFAATAHGLAIGDPVRLTAATMPTGFTAGTNYYVHATSFTADQFRLSLTPSGTVLTGTTNGTSVLFHTLVSASGSQSGTHTGGEVLGIIDEVNLSIQDGVGAVTLSNVPLPVQVTLSNIVEGSRVRVSKASNNEELYIGTAPASGVVSFVTYFQGSANISVRKSSTAPKYLPNETVGVVTSEGMDVYISQTLDTVAL